LIARFIGDGDCELSKIMNVPRYDVGLWAITHADLRHTARVRALLDFMPEAIAEALRTLESGADSGRRDAGQR
ncbi:MAG: LysR family transcriptional regulator, partial [Myxococcota bacterium]